MTHYPQTISKADLSWLLNEIVRGFEAGDTLEGFAEFTMSDDPGKFDVRASYRIGNLQGQGGMRIVGEIEANEPITPEIAATTLYFYEIDTGERPVKIVPGDWRRLLLDLISKSDRVNRVHLATIYPGEVAACEIAESADPLPLIRIAQSWDKS